MTSVTNNLNANYYNLNNSSSGQAQTGHAGGVPSLATYLNQTASGDSKSNTHAAYNLDLSPNAQNYLSGLSQTSATSNNPLTNSDTSMSFASSNGFLLSDKQQQTIQSIIAKYKDAPYTQDTFQKIQDDLTQAGLSPKQLSLEDNARNFSTTKVLVAALSGQSTSDPASSSSIQSDEKTNSDNYMQGIMKQWKNISTTASSTESAS